MYVCNPISLKKYLHDLRYVSTWNTYMKQIFTDDKKKCILEQFIVINVIINQVYILMRQVTFYSRKNQILADI